MGSFVIDLTNFQSISHANLELVEGINLLVGQSNSGKTAIIRAIKSLLENPSRAKKYIKHRTDSTCVEVDYGDNKLSWARNNKGASYVINDEFYEKLGTDNLFNILPDNGFVRDDDDNIMNIEGEWDLPFPFDRTPSQLFKLFENIFCISDSAVIIKSYKDEDMQYNKDKNDTKHTLEKVNAKINALTELEKEIDVKKVKGSLKALKEDFAKYSELQADIDKICRSDEFNKFKLDEVKPITTTSLQEYLSLEADIVELIKICSLGKFAKGLVNPPDLSDIDLQYLELKDSLRDIEKAGKAAEIDLSKKYVLQEDLTQEYISLAEDIKILENCKKIKDIDLSYKFDISDTMEQYEEMYKDYVEIISIYKNCKEKKEECTRLNETIQELNEKLSQIKVCPLCGHTLEGEHEC